MIALITALVAAYGVSLVYTANVATPARRHDWRGWTARLGGVSMVAVGGGALGYAVFGGVAAPCVCGAAAATVPGTLRRGRDRARRAEARESWPRMLEEIRILTSSLGRSIPQALLEVGSRAPAPLRPAFASAQREWLMTTDFNRTVAMLEEGLADATADAACETLLVAHEVGGGDLDRRLADLVEDRIRDLEGRKDARARQEGVRFARRFVVLVPLGMAVAGLAIGPGRAAYATAWGQLGIGTAAGLVAACWLWAGRLLRLPDEHRVFGTLGVGP